MNRMLLAYNADLDVFKEQTVPVDGTGELPGMEFEEAFRDAENMELATRLLEVAHESDLDRFIGSLLARAKTMGHSLSGPVATQLARILKAATLRVLPAITSASRSAIADSTGIKAAGADAPTAGRIFGLELEGLSPEDQEFEVAKSFVTFADAAIRNAAAIPARVPAAAAARSAATAAARRYAPGWSRVPRPGLALSPAESRDSRTARIATPLSYDSFFHVT